MKSGASSLLVWMFVALACVVGIAYLDASRESSAAFDDFAEEQALLARALGVGMSSSSASAIAAAPVSSIEHDPERVVLIARDGSDDLVRADGTMARSGVISEALQQKRPWVRLARPDAAALGLPSRTAVAGFSYVAGSSTHIVVLTSAARERDRELRVQSRLVASIVVGGFLVVAFGLAALRRQRRELELARELAVAETARTRDEQLARASRFAALGAFGTGIAHEISSPLGVIVGRAEQLLPKVEGDPRAKKAVEEIALHAARISQTIRDFSGLARGAPPSLAHVGADVIAYRAREFVAHRFESAGVELRLLVDDPPPHVACDVRLFVHALVNLLLNACDASAEGTAVGLRVSREADTVTFEVLDEGPGIRSEDAARVLEPFFTTKPVGAGSGLGLAIASEIVKHHQGRLIIEPRGPTTKGTRAVLELPALDEEAGR